MENGTKVIWKKSRNIQLLVLPTVPLPHSALKVCIFCLSIAWSSNKFSIISQLFFTWVNTETNVLQGIIKGEVSLYHWPPVGLVWISLFCKLKQKNVSCHTADSKPIKQEVNCTVILLPLVFPGAIFYCAKRLFVTIRTSLLLKIIYKYRKTLQLFT